MHIPRLIYELNGNWDFRFSRAWKRIEFSRHMEDSKSREQRSKMVLSIAPFTGHSPRFFDGIPCTFDSHWLLGHCRRHSVVLCNNFSDKRTVLICDTNEEVCPTLFLSDDGPKGRPALEVKRSLILATPSDPQNCTLDHCKYNQYRGYTIDL